MIVVDQNIPFGREAFEGEESVSTLPGREIRREDLRDASALIVRSVTRVDRSLLEGTPVKFVGTCTIGTDHLDIPWMESQGIRWASAPGCNARSVAEYVVAALALAHLEGRIDLSRHPRAGVIGVGRVGTQVARILSDLGLEVLLNDPPRREAEGLTDFVSLSEMLPLCDIVCAHLPLTRTGLHRTEGLITAELLAELPRGAMFLNAGRGSTSRTPELERILVERPDLTLVLDVWDPEPCVPPGLADAVFAGTPHIAGYSMEGKVEGTRRIRQAWGDSTGRTQWEPPSLPLAPLDASGIDSNDPWNQVCRILLEAYDFPSDGERFRRISRFSDEERGRKFDLLRKEYPVRREFRNRPIQNDSRLHPEARNLLERIGFRFI